MTANDTLFKYQGGGTPTSLALTRATQEFKDKARDPSKGFPMVTVLITDGVPNDEQASTSAADAMKAAGITLFTVGIGSSQDLAFLQQTGRGS